MNLFQRTKCIKQISLLYNTNLFLTNFTNIKRHLPLEFLATKSYTNSANNEKQKSAIINQKFSKEIGQATPLEKVKETTKTVSYLGVIIIGVGVTGLMFYATLRELFSSESPNNIYSAAFEKCCKDSKILDKLGEPIKAYGEETRRGRRQHVKHMLYNKGGINYLVMKFYIQGSRKKGVVHLEMKQINNKYEYNYLIIEVEGIFKEVIILEDHRNEETQSIDNSLI